MTTFSRAAAALALVALLAGALGACSAESNASTDEGAPGVFAKDSQTLIFGVVPDAVDTETNYQPLTDYIALKTGKSVEYRESTDYAALIEAAVAGKVDVASFSGFTYVIATDRGAKLTAISSIITEAGEEPGYYSEAIVPVDSPIQSLKDFAGKRVCFVDPSSTSGYLFPTFRLMEEGIDAADDITPVFAGKHDVSVTKTGEGHECEAGFAEDSEVARSSAVRVVDRTKVPGAPVVYSSLLPAEVQATLRDALSSVTIDEIIDAGIAGADSPAFRSVFAALSPVDDSVYDLIREICDKTGAKQCQS